MKLIMYHGSNNIIKMPFYDKGRKFSDFGKGFYLTTNIEMAKSWATRKKEESCYVNKYILETNELNSLTFDLNISWILFIANNRNLIKNVELKELLDKKYKNLCDYDIIIGPTADDRMFDTLDMFFNNLITTKHCIEALNSMNLDIQYNLKTQKAIQNLEFISFLELDEFDKEYYFEEAKSKKYMMNKKMEFVRKKFGKVGKYFDEIDLGDIDG